MFERLQSFLDGLSKRTVIVVGVIAALVVVLGGAGGAAFGYQQQIRETCADLEETISQLNEKVTATQSRAETVLNQVRDVETNDEYLDQGEDNALTRQVVDLSETTQLIDGDLECASDADIDRLRAVYVETNAQYADLSAAVSELDEDFYQYISERMKKRADEEYEQAAAAHGQARESADEALTLAKEGEYTTGFANSEDGATLIAAVKDALDAFDIESLETPEGGDLRQLAERITGQAEQIDEATAEINAAVEKLTEATSAWQETKRAEEAAAIAAQQAQQHQRGYSGGHNRSYNAPQRNYSGGGSGGNSYSGSGLQDSGYPGAIPVDPELLKEDGDGWNCSCIGDVCIGKACR